MKLVIKKTTAAQPYHSRIVASNGQILATSENYAAKQSAINAAQSIKDNAGSASIVDET